MPCLDSYWGRNLKYEDPGKTVWEGSLGLGCGPCNQGVPHEAKSGLQGWTGRKPQLHPPGVRPPEVGVTGRIRKGFKLIVI